MRRIYSVALFIFSITILLSSCVTSLNVVKRKYRPGYSVNISNDKHQKQAIDNEEILVEPQLDSLVEEKTSDCLVASSSNEESVICYYKSPSFIIPCDTPPKNKMDDPNWSLYKEKKPNPKGNSKWKPIEPFNLASFFVALGGILIASFIPTIGAWFVFLILLTMLILCIISLVRIKRNPNKYSKFSKVWDWIVVSLFLGLVAIGLIAFAVILASVA